MDITQVTAAAQGFQLALNAARSLYDLSSEGKSSDLRLKMAELVEALTKATLDSAALAHTVRERDDRIRELEKTLAIRVAMEFEDPFYWERSSSGSREGPYCVRCYHTDSKQVPLLKIEVGKWNCRVCREVYRDSSYREVDPNAQGRPRRKNDPYGAW